VRGELFETHDAEEHARARRTFAPEFNRGRAEAAAAPVAETLRRLCDERAERRRPFDLTEFAQQLLLAGMLASAFGVEVGLEEAERFVALRNRAAPATAPVFGSTGAGLLDAFGHPGSWVASRKAALSLRPVLAEYLGRADSLQATLARAAPRDPLRLIEGLVFSLVDAPSIVVAGLLRLGEQPELAAALRAELADGRLELCRGTALEGLRLGAGWMLGRVCHVPFMLGGVRVEPGDWLLASPHLIHRDERFWPDAERLDPGRWEPAAVAERSRYAFLTFGVSNRICTGRHLVTTLATHTVAELTRSGLALETDPRAISWRGAPMGGDVVPSAPVEVRL
jgi:cytochrome P450